MLTLQGQWSLYASVPSTAVSPALLHFTAHLTCKSLHHHDATPSIQPQLQIKAKQSPSQLLRGLTDTEKTEIQFSEPNSHSWSSCPSVCEHFLSVPSTEQYSHSQVIQGPHEFSFHLPTIVASSIILSWCFCNYTKLKVYSPNRVTSWKTVSKLFWLL